jgi:hypothetical protein
MNSSSSGPGQSRSRWANKPNWRLTLRHGNKHLLMPTNTWPSLDPLPAPQLGPPKSSRGFYLKLLLQPNWTKNKAMRAKGQKRYNFEQHNKNSEFNILDTRGPSLEIWKDPLATNRQSSYHLEYQSALHLWGINVYNSSFGIYNNYL